MCSADWPRGTVAARVDQFGAGRAGPGRQVCLGMGNESEVFFLGINGILDLDNRSCGTHINLTNNWLLKEFPTINT